MELYESLVCRDYAGKRPRQYMVQADSNTSLSLSSDTFRNRGNLTALTSVANPDP
jgi:hypothetical protein